MPTPTKGAPREPDWDMTPYFDAFGSVQYGEFREQLDADVASLLTRASDLGRLSAGSIDSWCALLCELERVSARTSHLAGYLGCLSAADSQDERIAKESAAAGAARSVYERVFVVVRAALGDATPDCFDALVAREELSAATYFLTRLRESARVSMEKELEGLASELAVTGINAWGRLYDQLSGRLEFELVVPGKKTETRPVSVTRSLLENEDAAVRLAALRGSNAAWESVGDATAACLNAIAGTRHTLYRRRGIDDFLEPALFDAGISRTTLDVLLATVEQRAETARGYLRKKAAILGRERLGFQDLMAPLPVASHERIPFDRARARIEDAFERRYPSLAEFARMAFERRWIDWQPRPGKRPGGFCSTSPLINESRVFITYNETLGDLSTLAHELGHAFHGKLMRDLRPWARRYPMTLAETASTFAEQLVIDAVLSDEDAPPEQRALILDARMQDAATFLLNIPMRFYFEEAFYRERAEGEVSVTRLKELMTNAQLRCYGDSLAEDELDPWFWASKLHFYITGISFYNFPYTFGYLFSMGIFAEACREGSAFLPRYEELLRLTGSEPAEGVARRSLGVDLEAPEFWNASFDLIDADATRFDDAISGLF